MEAARVTLMRNNQFTRKEMRNNNDDRISSLPDHIICHILSFLPTRHSVHTRILSTRWKYLFAFVPVLDFDSTTDIRAPNQYQYNINSKRFVDFVNKVFIMYNTPQMKKFRLASLYAVEDDFVSWVSSAICRNVQELDVSVSILITKALPCELFSLEKLSVLKLEGDLGIKLRSSAFLPSLKTLHLRLISSDPAGWGILSICPILEDLLLDSCDFGNVKVLKISHPFLRKLQIVECDPYEFVLDAPRLLYFDYLNTYRIHRVSGQIVLPSLVKARIYLEPVLGFNPIVELLTLVSHARHLYLSTISIEAFHGCTMTQPTFDKLTCLKIGKVSMIALKLLPDILNRCNLLEVLIFAQGFCYEKFDDNYTICYENVPSCVTVHLKEMVFSKCAAQKIEWKMVEYFLKNAQVLQKMNIRFQSKLSWKEKYEFSKKLLSFSKFSPNCQIRIDSDDENEDSDDESMICADRLL